MSERREWWIIDEVTTEGIRIVTVSDNDWFSEDEAYSGLNSIKVTEIRPGEIVIDREILHAAWKKLCGNGRPDIIKHLSNELFGGDGK